MPITRILQACRRELAVMAANLGPRGWPGHALPPASPAQAHGAARAAAYRAEEQPKP